MVNCFNEWYSRDISRKVRSAHRVRGGAGVPLSKPPYGYRKDPENPKFWIVDNEPAEVVQRIFQMYLDGHGVEQIAAQLECEKILAPNAYAEKHGLQKSGKSMTKGPYAWKSSMITKMLGLQEYCGDVVNFKTYSKSFKTKKRFQSPQENQVVFEGVHKPIIERDNRSGGGVNRGYESHLRANSICFPVYLSVRPAMQTSISTSTKRIQVLPISIAPTTTTEGNSVEIAMQLTMSERSFWNRLCWAILPESWPSPAIMRTSFCKFSQRAQGQNNSGNLGRWSVSLLR